MGLDRVTGISWPAARSAAHSAAVPLAPVRVPLARALGTTLAEPLRARTPLPPFDTAAMDGYAVAGPAPWQIIGRVLAGSPPPAVLAGGAAVEIATGAMVPAGAEAVLRYEDAEVVPPHVKGSVAAGRHIRPAGEECAAGAELLPVGTGVTPAVLGLAAAAGHDELPVRARAGVVAVVTGAELLRQGTPGQGRIRDAVGPVLPGLVAALGGELVDVRHVGDDRVALSAALADAAADVVLTSGASAGGPADHLHAVLAGSGARLLVDGVACRPGHPQVLAVLPDGRHVVGLPGNPLAALVGVLTLLAPLLAGLAGRALPLPACAPLDVDVAGRAGATTLLPARRVAGTVRPVDYGGSAMLRGAAVADGLIVVPPDARLPVGATVEVLDLPR